MTVPPVSSAAASPAPDPALRKAAEGFEALFLRQVMGAMRAAKLADDPLLGAGGETFRDLSDARMADGLAGQGGGLGIANLLLKQWGDQKGPGS